jgi:hypothetical protein
MLRTFEIKNKDSIVRRPPRGRCIYCGAVEYRTKSERKLGEEHVIAEGLGGILALEEAACEKCEKAINTFEQPILKTVLYAPRVHLGIRRKRRKRGQETTKIQGRVDGKDVEVFLPIDKIPALLFLLRLGPPGLLVGRPPDIADMTGAWVLHLNVDKIIAPQGFQSFASPVMDTFKFSQFLAKIAHGFAVDTLGDGFNPTLPDFIKNDARSPRFDLIGGNSQTEPMTANLHELGIEWMHANGSDYAVVRIRLFSNLGAPTYLVIAGTRKAS